MRLRDPGIIRFMVEHVLLYLLRHNRQEPTYVGQQADRRWQWHESRFAPDLRVGIMGRGSIGRRCAEVLASLDFRVSAWSRSQHSLPGIDCHAGSDQLAAFLAPCDYVVCILPQTRATRDLLDARALAAMKPGAYFINVGRGRLVVEEDLLAALDSGHLSGAALDVFRTEPLPPDSPLWAHPKIMITPHDAGSVPRGSILHIAENHRRLLAGQPLINLADRERGY